MDNHLEKLLLVEHAFMDVCDNLKIRNEPDGNYTHCHLVTITSRYRCKQLSDFRKEAYNRVDGQLDCVMEYHEKSNKVHAHGYYYSDHSEPPGMHINQDDLVISIALPLELASKEDIERWTKYCRKDCEYTLDRDNDNKKSIYARFRAYGKRTQFMTD